MIRRPPRSTRTHSFPTRRSSDLLAYTRHTDIGNQAVAAKSNGEFAPLRSELKSGDAVEIITSPASRPSTQWLNYVRTGRARSEIRHYLRTVKYEESVAFGQRLLNQAFKQLNLNQPADDNPEWKKQPKGSCDRSPDIGTEAVREREDR